MFLWSVYCSQRFVNLSKIVLSYKDNSILTGDLVPVTESCEVQAPEVYHLSLLLPPTGIGRYCNVKHTSTTAHIIGYS